MEIKATEQDGISVLTLSGRMDATTTPEFESAARALLVQGKILMIIDMADLEFPNDLLWELDRMEFYIPETGKTVKAKHRPIVIITSNAEKELPDAFLRRCIFHYIAFPDPPMMERIVRAHYPDLDRQLVEQALDQFYRLRDLDLQKKPSTSELLDWALSIGGVDPQALKAALPFAGVLLKKPEDLDAAARRRR